MPTIPSQPKLTLKVERKRKLVSISVKYTINTSALERAMFQAAPAERWFRITCKMRGADNWPNQDNTVYVLPQRHYLPGGAIKIAYDFEFQDTVGFDALDEDAGGDELYARLVIFSYLTNSNLGHRDSNRVGISV